MSGRRLRSPALEAALLIALAIAPMASAQHVEQAPSRTALEQVRALKEATTEFASPEHAQAAGYRPVFGWLPTMGTHWIKSLRAADAKPLDLRTPDQFMYSQIDGKQVLVGAAYAFFTTVGDTTRPASFDGNPSWHEHPDLAPPGQTLVMLHVWFVPSPDGPFAGHNPNLPFWALGLTPPDESRMHDPAEAARIRKTALALSLVADTSGIFPILQRRAEVHDVVAAQREAVRKLLPKLDGKIATTDRESWDHAGDEAAAHWQLVREAYLASARNPIVNERIRRFMDEMESGAHGMDHVRH